MYEDLLNVDGGGVRLFGWQFYVSTAAVVCSPLSRGGTRQRLVPRVHLDNARNVPGSNICRRRGPLKLVSNFIG